MLSFNGSSYAQVGNADATLDLGAAAWTAELWVKPDSGGDRRQFLVGQWGDPGEASWALELEEGYVIGETHNGAYSVRLTDSVALTLNTWHHIAFSFDHGSGSVYADGKVIAASNQLPLPMVGVQPVRFGAQAPSSGVLYGASYMFTGEMADVRLWSVARTAEQIAGGRFTRLHGNEPGLLAYWPLDDGTGDPKDLVKGLVADLGGAGHEVTEQPGWVQDTLPAK